MRDGIPIFFSSCGKENGHSWAKEKTLRDELTGKAVNSSQTGTGRHELPTKSGSLLPVALYPNIKSAYPRTCGCRAKWRAKPNRRISTPVRSASLRTTRSVSGFILVSRPSSPWGLVSKGGGRGPRPLCRFKGVRGEIEIPPRFSLGGPGGTFSFQKRISPLASRPGNRDCPLREQAVLSDFQIK